MLIFSLLNFTQKQKEKYAESIESWVLHEISKKLLYAHVQKYDFYKYKRRLEEKEYKYLKPLNLEGVYGEILDLTEGIGLEKLGSFPEKLDLKDPFSQEILFLYYSKKVSERVAPIFKNLIKMQRGILDNILIYIFGK